jgi:4-hydroxybenzoate polyprenyltransferase
MASWDPGRLAGGGKARAIARLLRLEHTLFSLPFAYAGAAIADPYSLRDPKIILLIALAVLGLRSAGMAYNNIADLDIDKLNPRTSKRPLVTGSVTLREAWIIVAAGSILYYASAALLNKYALLLSPLLWIAAMTYPHAKRLHWLPHIHLGLVLGLVVFGGAIAAYGGQAGSLAEALSRVPWEYVAAVAFWVAGFDTYYAVMDLEFDRRHGLGSVPARLGVNAALNVSLAFHALFLLLLIASILVRGLNGFTIAGLTLATILVAYQHALIRRSVEFIPKAFNVNLAVGVIISMSIIIDKLALTA